MIKGYYCANIFSKRAAELIKFYMEILEVPFVKTDDDNTNGVYLGFIENAPLICIWDCQKGNMEPTGFQSFVFHTDNLDDTIQHLKDKGLYLSEPVKYDWGTYELRLQDVDGNEIVIVEFLS